ncbi:MAG: hypothetical protein FD124_1418 [Alphaproteobacteria bacterium]|nr:MAG: hypothetical protein FD160_3358 [Caulobacteraceae bacterium]TPW07061.1 MAG: hypothetical protein FD124_1418 [Alphaproteobacteria bacterium]
MKSFASIRSAAGRAQPAMALVEVVVAAAIIATAALLFLGILLDARADVARARAILLATAQANALLLDAQTNWPDIPRAGTQEGQSWTLDCQIGEDARSPRLVLLDCTARVTPAAGLKTPIVLRTTWPYAPASFRP